MGTQQKQVELKSLLGAAGPYPLEAFNFVREGLTYTAEQIHGEPEEVPEPQRHVSGQQLCLGLREYAIKRYGLMAPIVLEHWKVRRTDDFGRIVFAMIDVGLMSRTNDDTLEDFRGVFDFHEAFSRDELLEHLGSN